MGLGKPGTLLTCYGPACLSLSFPLSKMGSVSLICRGAFRFIFSLEVLVRVR